VHDFLNSRHLAPDIYPIDGVGVFFRKTDTHENITAGGASQASARERSAPATDASAAAFTPVNVRLCCLARSPDGRRTGKVRQSPMRTKTARTAQHRLPPPRTEAINPQEQADRAQKEAVQLREQIASALEGSQQGTGEDHPYAGQFTAAQADAARLRRDLQIMHSSRSWRLTSGYRAIGRALARVGMRRP